MLIYVMICDSIYIVLYFFFFKQKTAYEMRISDWSSDVCSSDLRAPRDDEEVGDLGIVREALRGRSDRRARGPGRGACLGARRHALPRQDRGGRSRTRRRRS